MKDGMKGSEACESHGISGIGTYFLSWGKGKIMKNIWPRPQRPSTVPAKSSLAEEACLLKT
jgi:hypothetical protein